MAYDKGTPEPSGEAEVKISKDKFDEMMAMLK